MESVKLLLSLMEFGWAYCCVKNFGLSLCPLFAAQCVPCLLHNLPSASCSLYPLLAAHCILCLLLTVSSACCSLYPLLAAHCILCLLHTVSSGH